MFKSLKNRWTPGQRRRKKNKSYGTRRANLRFEQLEGRRLLATVHGDFNGDGYGDLAVGAPGATVREFDRAGAVYVSYGTADGPGHSLKQTWTQDDLHYTNPEDHDLFGGALAVGDYNGDGYDDLAIGAAAEDWGSIYDVGVVHIVYGSAKGLTFSSNQLWRQIPSLAGSIMEAGDQFGDALEAGDINNDGYDDLVVGSPNEDIGTASDAGSIVVIFGSRKGLTSVGSQYFDQNMLATTNAESGDLFGSALAIGDFNNDGFDDVAVGVPRENVYSITAAGVVNVIYGGANGLTTADNHLLYETALGSVINVKLTHRMGIFSTHRPKSEEWDEFGAAMASGDFNGDGYDDLAIGAPGQTVFGDDYNGAVTVVYGTAARLGDGLKVVLQSEVIGHVHSSGFGESLAVGDFNGDGYADLGIGSCNDTVGSMRSRNDASCFR